MGLMRRTIRQPVSYVSVPVRGPERIGTAMMASLGLAAATGSPMADGGARASYATGAGITGRDARRTGALQVFRGLAAAPGRSALGIQGGPSQQPAYPSTGSSAPPTIYHSLAGMDLPQVLSNPGVR